MAEDIRPDTIIYASREQRVLDVVSQAIGGVSWSFFQTVGVEVLVHQVRPMRCLVPIPLDTAACHDPFGRQKGHP